MNERRRFANFSVLMSIYYKESIEFYRQAMESILSQTLMPQEIVLVEDGVLGIALERVVQEYEEKVKNEYPFCQMKVIRFKENRGLGFSLNDGLKYCSHELIARADTDDICKPDRLIKQLKVFEEHPEYDLVSSWIDEIVDSPENVTSVRCLPEMPIENLKYAKKRCPVNHPSA